VDHSRDQALMPAKIGPNHTHQVDQNTLLTKDCLPAPARSQVYIQSRSLNSCDTALAWSFETVMPFCCNCSCTSPIVLRVLNNVDANSTVTSEAVSTRKKVQCQIRIASECGSLNILPMYIHLI
jgi:hypothetical protein